MKLSRTCSLDHIIPRMIHAVTRGVVGQIFRLGVVLIGAQLAAGCLFVAAKAAQSKPKPKQYDLKAQTRCPSGTEFVGTRAHKYCVLPSGEKHGRYIRFHRNGQKRFAVRFSNGLVHGTMKQWRADGTPDYRGGNTFINGTGDWLVFGAARNKHQRGRLVAGKRDGVWTEWHTDGTVSYAGRYRDGLRVGKHNWYYPTSRRRHLARYNNGSLRYGRSWFKNGKKRWQGGFLARTRHGGWLFWRSDGSKKAAGRFYQGERDGVWRAWNGAGETVTTWQRGTRVKKPVAKPEGDNAPSTQPAP